SDVVGGSGYSLERVTQVMANHCRSLADGGKSFSLCKLLLQLLSVRYINAHTYYILDAPSSVTSHFHFLAYPAVCSVTVQKSELERMMSVTPERWHLRQILSQIIGRYSAVEEF